MTDGAHQSGLKGMLATVRRIGVELAPALTTTVLMAVPLFVLAFAIFMGVVVSAIAFLQSDNTALNEIGRRLSELTLSEVLAFVTSLVRDYPVVAVGAGALSILSVGFATIRAVIAQVMARFDDADLDLQGRMLALERRIAQQNDLLIRLTERAGDVPAAPAASTSTQASAPPPREEPLHPAPPGAVFTPRDAAEQALRLMSATLALQAAISEHRALPPWDAKSLVAIRLARLTAPPAFASGETRPEAVATASDDKPKRKGLFERNLFKDGLFDKPSKSAPPEMLDIQIAREKGVAERAELIDRVNAVNRAIIAHTSTVPELDPAPVKVRDRIDRLAKAVDDDLRQLQDLLYRIVATHAEDLLPRLETLRSAFASKVSPSAQR